MFGYVVSVMIGMMCVVFGDMCGYRAFAVAYGTLYAASCLLLWLSVMMMLIVSWIFGGIVYLLLFINFELWVIMEVDVMGIDRKKLAGVFSVATLFNGASAVLVGLVGNFVVEFVELS